MARQEFPLSMPVSLYFAGGDQCIFGVNDDVSGFALNFKAVWKRERGLIAPLRNRIVLCF
jgi:hypothetical protein